MVTGYDLQNPGLNTNSENEEKMEGFGIFTMDHFIERNKDKISEIINFDLKGENELDYLVEGLLKEKKDLLFLLKKNISLTNGYYENRVLKNFSNGNIDVQVLSLNNEDIDKIFYEYDRFIGFIQKDIHYGILNEPYDKIKYLQNSFNNVYYIESFYKDYNNNLDLFYEKVIDKLDNFDFSTYGEKEQEIKEDVLKITLDKIKKINIGDKGYLDTVTDIIQNIEVELIKSGTIFKNIKDKDIKSLDDLNKADIGIEYKKLKLSELNKEEKNKIKKEIISLYYQNYDNVKQKSFLKEIESEINIMFKGEEDVELTMFYVDDEVVLSGYFKNSDNGKLYGGAFNAKDGFKEFSFGFWVFEKLLEEKEVLGENLTWTVTEKFFDDTEDDFVKNRNFGPLKRIYKKYGYEKISDGKNNNSTFINLEKNQ